MCRRFGGTPADGSASVFLIAASGFPQSGAAGDDVSAPAVGFPRMMALAPGAVYSASNLANGGKVGRCTVRTVKKRGVATS